ncbi:histidine phosphatase superfamily [Diplogelasinospora grovesii]|uniref:Histidine phosphatase superfamily n=1 Tax=Diplogelasinospora grovesii TaxID=303347 RepID=A0AAN6NGE6_9PEZI|nr:histidine phosphatase superfamily [Diplogelasinospora grovesii]
MTLEVIYVTRHGFRSNWLVDPSDGTYASTLRSPTGLPADPALTAHGVDQARELGQRLLTVVPRVERVYSSPYYRCLQTVEPYMRSQTLSLEEKKVRAEHGIAEWYGSTGGKFQHPVPAPITTLDSLFRDMLDLNYRPVVVPDRHGESIDELHNRVAVAMEKVIEQCDRDGVKAILLCTHAAVVIALGRVLTGNMPENVAEVDDFQAFTCGLSIYQRRANEAKSKGRTKAASSATNDGGGDDARTADHAQTLLETGAEAAGTGAELRWRGGKGVKGGWDCQLNSDCSHLSGGEERGWRFSGEEAFDTDTDRNKSMLDDAGVVRSGTVQVVEGKTTKETGGPRL